jgi:hypothetical protein
MKSAPKTITQLLASILKRMRSMPFFLLWSADLISFRVEQSKGVSEGVFTCYCYHSQANCQRLMYEIRRRTSMRIRECMSTGLSALKRDEQTFSKIEAAHREIFNRHRPLGSAQASVWKGKELAA